jgi:hypothetical protein
MEGASQQLAWLYTRLVCVGCFILSRCGPGRKSPAVGSASGPPVWAAEEVKQWSNVGSSGSEVELSLTLSERLHYEMLHNLESECCLSGAQVRTPCLSFSRSGTQPMEFWNLAR